MAGFHLFVCVDGSVAALAAVRLAIDLVARHGGDVRAVSVLPGDGPGRRGARDVGVVLDRVARMATERDVAIETEMLTGDPLRAIVRDARAWHPDLVLIGRTGRSGPGSPMVGSLAMHLVEFAEWPVVVVPERLP